MPGGNLRFIVHVLQCGELLGVWFFIVHELPSGELLCGWFFCMHVLHSRELLGGCWGFEFFHVHGLQSWILSWILLRRWKRRSRGNKTHPIDPEPSALSSSVVLLDLKKRQLPSSSCFVHPVNRVHEVCFNPHPSAIIRPQEPSRKSDEQLHPAGRRLPGGGVLRDTR